MKTHVIARSIDPIDLVDGHQFRFAAIPDCEPARVSPLCLDRRCVIGHLLNLSGSTDQPAFQGGIRPELGSHPLNGNRETIAVKGFQQIVHGIQIKRIDGVVVISRRKNNAGHIVRLQPLHYVETREDWHLNVQNQNIRRIVSAGLEYFAAIFETPQHLNIGHRFQQILEISPRQRLIVRQHDRESFTVVHESITAASIGITSTKTLYPPISAFSIFSRPPSP